MFEQLVEVIRAQQRSGRIKRQDPQTQAYVAWSAVHGLAMLVVEGQIKTTVDVEALARQATATLLDGMRPRKARG